MWLFHRDEFLVLKNRRTTRPVVTSLAHGGLADAWPFHLAFSLIVFERTLRVFNNLLPSVGLLCDTDLKRFLSI